MAYSTEENVYEATGLNTTVVQNLSNKNAVQVTTLIDSYIAKADQRIKRLLKVPITIRKEEHIFDYNDIVELGPHEDSFEFFGAYSPEDCVEEVYAIYLAHGRVKLPYPKDCDSKTEAITDMNSTNCTLVEEATIVKCGDASVKATFLANGLFNFPQNANLNKNIQPWEFIGFWFRTSDTSVTFTIKLYDKDGNTNTKTFTLDLADTWEIVSLRLDIFTGSIDWSTTKLQKIEIIADGACTAYFDNFNFNDGMFWTTPEGVICWSDPSVTPYFSFEVTYAYDPYKVIVPKDLENASAKLAGVKLLDYVLGARQRIMGFKQRAEDLESAPDRVALEITRHRLRKEYLEDLEGLGYGTYEGIGVA